MEHRDLLHLLSSAAARQAGLDLPAAAESPDWSLWQGDRWIRAAALAAWFDRATLQPCARPAIALCASGRMPSPPDLPVRLPPRRPAVWRIAALAALNVVAQVEPLLRTSKKTVQPRPEAPSSGPGSPAGDELAGSLIDLARRACAFPFVSGSTRVMSKALVWYLRLGGKTAAGVRETAEGQPGKQYWVEVDGLVVDLSGAETPLVADPG